MRDVLSRRQNDFGFHNRFSSRFGGGCEQIALPFCFVAKAISRSLYCAIDSCEVLGAVGSKAVESSGLDEHFERALLQNLGVNTLREVEDTLEGAVLFPFFHDGADRGIADSANGSHAEGDLAEQTLRGGR